MVKFGTEQADGSVATPFKTMTMKYNFNDSLMRILYELA